MSAGTDDLLEAPAGAPKAPSPTRPFYWSVRREIWENSSLYIAPLVAAAIVLFGYLMSAIYLPRMARRVAVHAGSAPHRTGPWSAMSANASMHPPNAAEAMAIPYQFAIVAIAVTGIIVAMFYCLNALNNERRDRSILFWKSLPVSDRTTVLSKFAIPMVVVPVTIFATVLAAHLVMLLINAGFLIARGKSLTVLLTDLPLAHNWLVLGYGLVALSLWYAPLYGWLLLVSGWARRAPFLWAVLPPLAIMVVEKLAFDTSYFGQALSRQPPAFTHLAGGGLAIAPLRFLSNPDLWIGLVVAVGFIAAAIWQRRYREPN